MRQVIRVVALALAIAAAAGAVVLDSENRLSFVLADGTQVYLLGQAGDSPGTSTLNYYYLPAGLRLSKRPDATPEFLFLKFTSESREGASGGLMHFLMEYGLTPEQEAELAAKLKTSNRNAVLKGPVEMEQAGDTGSFQIVSATLSDNTMTKSLVSSGKAPLVPGGKAAVAARLSPEGAQLLAATFEKARSITDVSLALSYTYTTLTPAAKGRITFDWAKLESHYESLNAEYSRRQTGTSTVKVLFIPIWSSPTYSYSYDELRQQYDFLQEKEIVKIQFDEEVADERVAKVREAFFQYFLNTLTEQASGEQPKAPGEKEKSEVPNIREGNSYHYNKTAVQRAYASKQKIISLDYRMAIRRPYQIVGNLASWYNGVRDNPKCVATVNLNDPFYQHRDINFILDLENKEIFDDALNYVTVNVRKKRSSGNAFEDRLTFDAARVKEKGLTGSVTYARGDDRNPDAYEYKAQWSLKGGLVYPENPDWMKGDWQAVTLAPPVRPQTLEVEGDLDALRASNIARVTVQVHYPRFGQEVEDNIQLSAAGNNPIVSKKIFLDRGAKGYVYRLIVNHKTEGKMVLPWSAQVGDYYVYASIPKELLVESELKRQAKLAAANVVESATEKVLDKFKDVLGGGR